MREKCPFLPQDVPSRPWVHGKDRGEVFYENCLRYAQGYWMDGKPAQGILQLNKALSTEFADNSEVLEKWPLPYRALEWILEKGADGSCGFLGNPVRHFQHLATRMSGERKEIRIWRAWKCFYIARRVLGEIGGYEMDGRQMAREGIFIPAERAVLSKQE